MSGKSVNAPPELVPEKYASWKKAMVIWELATNVPPEKRAPTVFLSLNGKAQEAILELDPAVLSAKDGMQKLYEKLDSLFKVDSAQAALAAYAEFEQYRRPGSMTISDFNIEFDRMVQRLMDHDIKLPEAVLAHRVLKSAGLSEENEKLIIATVADATYADMMKQVKKVMGIQKDLTAESRASPTIAFVKPKNEPLEVGYSDSDGNSCAQPQGEEADSVLYGNSYTFGRGRGRAGRPGTNYRGRYRQNRGGRGRVSSGRGSGGQNPIGYDGKPSKCAICGSIMHWARDCPHKEGKVKYDDDSLFDTSIVLMNYAENVDSSLLGQTLGCVVLDSGCCRTVCGITWYNCYLDTLPQPIREQIKTEESSAKFRFGNRKVLDSKFCVKLPCRLAGKNIKIKTDVVDSVIPLLLSKDSMKLADTVIDFKEDTVSVFGRNLKLSCASSGHYFLPLSRISSESNEELVLFATHKIAECSPAEKKKLAIKLHRQFSHPTYEKLSGLVNDAGVEDDEFLSTLESISSDCDTCKKFKKTQPRPVVGFSLAKRFNQVVSLDLKEINGVRVIL